MAILWSQKNPAPWRGLALARERGWILAWDARHVLQLFNQNGERQAQWQAPADLGAAACADDGGTFAAVGVHGEVWLLAPDLVPRWERRLPARAAGVALEAFGRYLAAADGSGVLHLFDRTGKAVWRALNPRPLRFLSFVPERPELVGAADFGLVVRFDAGGRCLGRDGPVVHFGSLAVRGDGTTLVLACFSEGYCRYDGVDLKRRRFVPGAAPCHLAAMSYDGETLLTANMEANVTWRDGEGRPRGEMELDDRPVALALEASGARAVVALADGKLVCARA